MGMISLRKSLFNCDVLKGSQALRDMACTICSQMSSFTRPPDSFMISVRHT